MANDIGISSESANARKKVRWAAYAVILGLMGGLLTAAVCRVKPLLSANDRSRWCTVWSLVERGTYQIDEIDAAAGWATIDKVRHEGHYYSSKPPILSTLVAGVYWVIRAVTGWTLDNQTDEVTRTILFIVNVVPFLLCTLLVIGLAERYAASDFAKIFVVATFALATFLTTFSVTLNNHTVAALSLVVSIYASCRILADGSTSAWSFVLAGFFAAFTVVNELPAAAFGVALFLILALRDPVRTMKSFLPAALVPLAGFFVVSYVATGDWKPFYAYYGTEKYKYIVDGVPSYWMHPGGLDANQESPFLYFLNCTIGHHGIFSLSPVFLFSLITWMVTSLSRGSRLRIWYWLGGGLTAIVLAFYLTRTQNYNYGGNCAGLRWAFWLIPLWVLSMIPALDAITGRRGLQGMACMLLAATTFSSWYAIENPWQHPWLFRLMERWGWIDYSHRPEPFNRPVTTFFPLLPEDEVAHEWIEFTSLEPDGGTTRLRLTDRGSVVHRDKKLRKIDVRWHFDADGERSFSILIDPTKFNAGEPPANYLVSIEPANKGTSREAVDAFLQGMPTPRTYRRGTLRYVKTALRHDAFECRLAASQVWHEAPGKETSDLHRIDVWLTGAVPFGVLQFEQTVREGETEEIVSLRKFTATASSRTFNGQGSTKGSPSRAPSSELNIPAN